jgi:hypothetical protein
MEPKHKCHIYWDLRDYGLRDIPGSQLLVTRTTPIPIFRYKEHNFSLIVPRILFPTLLLSPTPVKSVRFATPAHLRTADPLTLEASGPLPPSPTREFPEVPCLSTARQFQLRHEY